MIRARALKEHRPSIPLSVSLSKNNSLSNSNYDLPRDELSLILFKYGIKIDPALNEDTGLIIEVLKKYSELYEEISFNEFPVAIEIFYPYSIPVYINSKHFFFNKKSHKIKSLEFKSGEVILDPSNWLGKLRYTIDREQSASYINFINININYYNLLQHYIKQNLESNSTKYNNIYLNKIKIVCLLTIIINTVISAFIGGYKLGEFDAYNILANDTVTAYENYYNSEHIFLSEYLIIIIGVTSCLAGGIISYLFYKRYFPQYNQSNILEQTKQNLEQKNKELKILSSLHKVLTPVEKNHATNPLDRDEIYEDDSENYKVHVSSKLQKKLYETYSPLARNVLKEQLENSVLFENKSEDDTKIKPYSASSEQIEITRSRGAELGDYSFLQYSIPIEDESNFANDSSLVSPKNSNNNRSLSSVQNSLKGEEEIEDPEGLKRYSPTI